MNPENTMDVEKNAHKDKRVTHGDDGSTQHLRGRYDGSTGRSQAPQRIFKRLTLIIEATCFFHNFSSPPFFSTVEHPFKILSAVCTGGPAPDVYIRPRAMRNCLLKVLEFKL